MARSATFMYQHEKVLNGISKPKCVQTIKTQVTSMHVMLLQNET